MTKPARTVLRLCIFGACGAVLLGAQSSPTGQRVYGRINPTETQTLGIPVPGIPGTPVTARGNTVRIVGKSDAGASVDLRTMIAADSTFEFSVVPPGEYQVTAPPSSIAPVAIRIGNAAVPELQLGVPLARVSGTVIVEGGGPSPRFQLEWTTASPNEARRVALITAAPRFESEVLPGTLRVTATALPQGFSVRSMTADGVDLMRQTLTVRSGETVNIATTLGVSTPSPFFRVTGRASASPGSKPANLIRLSGPATTVPLTAAVNPDGSFEFPKVLPGEYEARVLPSAIHLTKTLIVGNADVRDVVIVAPVIQELVGDFVKIEPGEFIMGCSPGDAQCEVIESPPHRVGITKAFEIGKYEVTQSQWEAVMGTNPSQFKGRDRPVEGLTTWQDTQEFIERLNMLSDGYRYRLPTEAEWEYAARGGTTTPFPGGDLNVIAWTSGNADTQTHPVGQKQSNAWGIYDMIGNVQEWVQDFYSTTYYAESPVLDPMGPALGSDHVVRGGAWSHIPQWSRVSFRRNLVNRGSFGLRLAREVIPK